MLIPGQILDLNKEDRSLLGSEISDLVDDLERSYSQLFNDIKIWWEWYDATPVSSVKNFPFKNASNIVVPLIAIMSDSLVARLFGAIFGGGKRVWTTFTENEHQERFVKNVGRHINWAARNDFDIKLPLYDALSELVPIGSSVLAGSWRTDVRSVFSHQGRGKSRRIVSQEVNFARGVNFEHVPREQILWDTNFCISEAPAVVREFHFTWSWLSHLSQINPGWDRETVEDLRGQEGVESPSRKVGDHKDREDSRTASQYTQPHDIRECWVDWPILRSMGFDKTEKWRPGEEEVGTPNIPMVATIHRKTRQILQLKAAPYFWPGKPFFDFFVKKRSGRGHSVGMSKRLEHSQLALTTIINQAIDARTRANSVWAKTSLRKYMNEPIDPSHPVFVNSMDQFEAFNLPTNNFQDLSVMQAVQTMAERLTGQSDPNFGQNTRQGGHPAPATSTLALLQQGDTMSLPTREMIRIQLSKLGQFAATLYQQFDTDEDGRLRRIFGPEDARDIEQWLYPTDPIVGLVEFDLAAMSQSNSPQTEMNRAIQVTQMNTNYWAFVLRGMQVLQQAQGNPMIVQAVLKSIEGQTQSHMRFLEASDVDDIERYVLQLQQSQNQEAQRLQELAGGLGELAVARGALADTGLEGAEGAAPGGALLAPGANGAIQ